MGVVVDWIGVGLGAVSTSLHMGDVVRLSGVVLGAVSTSLILYI